MYMEEYAIFIVCHDTAVQILYLELKYISFVFRNMFPDNLVEAMFSQVGATIYSA